METLKILMLEDSDVDAEIIQRLLKKDNPSVECRLCMTKEEYVAGLASFHPQVILADNALPQFDASEALNIVNHLCLQIPFIMVTGTVSEEFAVDMIKRGADDYVLKDRLARLPAAIDTALKNRRAEKEKAFALEQLVKSEEKYRTLVEQASDGIFIADSSGKFVMANNSACTLSGFTQEEIRQLTIYHLVHPESLAADPFHFEEMKLPMGARSERKMICKDGTVKDVEISAKFLSDNRFLAFIRDITDRKRAAAVLNEEREKFARVAATSPGLIFTMKIDGTGAVSYPYTSSSFDDVFGCDQVVIKDDAACIFSNIYPSDLQKVLEAIRQTQVALEPFKTVYRYQHPVKGLVWHEVNALPLAEPDGSVVCHGIVIDITHRKRDEEKIVKTNRLYAFISQVNQVIVRTTEEEVLFSEICNIAVEYGKFKMAWIGSIEQDTAIISPVTHAGNEKGFVRILADTFANAGPDDPCPAAAAILTGRYYMCNDIETNTEIKDWKQAALERGYQSCIALPVTKAGRIYGLLNVFAGEKHFFDDSEISLLQEVTIDISFALEVFEKERLRQKANEQLSANEKRFRKLLENGNDAFAILDPAGQPLYISSSATRVLGYSEEEIFNMNMMSLVHPDHLQEVADTLGEVMANPGIPFEGHISRLLHKDGTYHWFEDTITNMLHDPDVGGIIDNFRDVTERMNSQAALAESEEKHRNIVENITDILCTHDLQGKVMSVNINAGKNLGYTIDEMMQMNVKDILAPHSMERFGDYIATLENHGFAKGLMYVRTKAGEDRVWEFRNSLRTDTVATPYVYGFAQDVTERIRAEEVLKESEKTFSRIFYLNPSICAINDLDTDQFVDVNEAFLHYFGFKKEEVIGKTSAGLGIFDAAARQQVIDNMDDNGVVHNMEASLRTKRGERRDVLLSTSNIYINDREYGYMVAIDITERKKADAAIRASEEKYRTLVEQAFDGIINYRPDGVIITCNQSATTNTGYSQKELIGMNVAQLFSAEDLQNKPLDFNRLKAGYPTLDYRRLKKKDGSYADMEIVTKMVGDGNMMAVGRDITLRKKAEAQQALMASIVNSSDDAIISKNLDGIITSWNRGAESLYGYTEKEMLGNTIAKLVPPDLLGEEKAILKKISQGDYVQHYETERVRKDGTRVFVSLTVSPVRNSKGTVVGASKIARDISERKAAERVLKNERDKFTKIAATSPGLIYSFRIDTTGRFSFPYTSSAVERLFGFTHAEITNDVDKIFNLSYPEDVKRVKASIAASATSMLPWKDEFRYRHPKKGELWLGGHSIPMPDPEGGIIWHGIITDITDVKNAEKEKEFEHNNLNALINNTHDLIWSIDKDYNLISSNLAFIKTIRKLSGNTVERGTNLMLPGFSKDDLARYKGFYDRALKGETFTELVKTGTAKEVWSEISFYPINEGRRVIGTACFSHDITARKKSEEIISRNFKEKQQLAGRLETILNTLPANIALINEKGIIIDVNDVWKGFADNNGFIGNHYGVGDDYIKIALTSTGKETADGKEVARGIRDVLEKKINEFIYEYPCHSPGVERWFRMVVSPITGRQESGAVIMHVDISELRRLEAERMVSRMEEQKKITQAMILGQEKERNAIGRELHDNMNQILAGINLLLGMLRTKPERLPEYLPLCIENINLAIHENRKIAHELVSPNQVSESLIHQVERLCTNMLQTAGLKTSLDADYFDEGLVTDDQKLAIYRVVQEQCSNIVKYAQASEVAFKLSTNNNLVTLGIADNGLGMKRDKRTDGIGLQNMMSRISVLNGTLQIDSEPGIGFRITVEIPIG